MICQICNNDGVLNSVNGNEFYYCRTCKVEITVIEKYVSKYQFDITCWQIIKQLHDLRYTPEYYEHIAAFSFNDEEKS